MAKVSITPMCGYCGEAMRGNAAVGDVTLCHASDQHPSCYVAVTVYQRPLLDGRIWTARGWSAPGRPDRYPARHCSTCTCEVK